MLVPRKELQAAQRLLAAVLGEHGGGCHCARCEKVSTVHAWIGRTLKEKP